MTSGFRRTTSASLGRSSSTSVLSSAIRLGRLPITAPIRQSICEFQICIRVRRRKNALRNPYVRAIRLASDWIEKHDDGGIVAFVINGGFIDSKSFDGFRKAVAEEFDAAYCFNLRGNARTAGERRRNEGGGVFGASAQNAVAILFLVRRPSSSPARANIRIHYRDIGDRLSRAKKLSILQQSSLAKTEWQVITPDVYGDWINQQSDAFSVLRPLKSSDITSSAPIFLQDTQGIVTSRDAWCYNSSKAKLDVNIRRSVAFYDDQVEAFHNTNPTGKAKQKAQQAKAFVIKDETQFHWSP